VSSVISARFSPESCSVGTCVTTHSSSLRRTTTPTFSSRNTFKTRWKPCGKSLYGLRIVGLRGVAFLGFFSNATLVAA
jgi:hypothetical protein